MEKEKECHLLHRLPKELRDYIWELAVLNEDRAICIGRPHYDFHKALQPSLAQTCHQTRSEVLKIFYGDVVFDLGAVFCPYNMYRTGPWFLEAIGVNNRRMIKHAFIELLYEPTHRDFSLGFKKFLRKNIGHKQVEVNILSPATRASMPQWVQDRIKDLPRGLQFHESAMAHVIFN